MFEGLLQPTHLLLILLIVVLIFGPKKLPEIGKSLGQAIRGFKESVDQARESMNRPDDEKPGGPSDTTKGEITKR